MYIGSTCSSNSCQATSMTGITFCKRLKIPQQLNLSRILVHGTYSNSASSFHISSGKHSTCLSNHSDDTSKKLHTKASVDDKLKEIFSYKNSILSNWIIETKVQDLCNSYYGISKGERYNCLRSLAFQYAVNHESICQLAKKLLCITSDNQRQMIVNERTLKNALIPSYHWLFIIMGRLEYGVKFLVDLRTDLLEFISELKDPEEIIVVQQLNLNLRDLLLLWFSVGFLRLERITWHSPCDMLQKVSDYEAIHPIKNWADLKKRVGPYRRCYVFTHASMPGEPLVVLHTALCDSIPSSVKGIEESEKRILGEYAERVSFMQEDKSKIKAAIFYSIASTQKGLQGIELGNYLIKEVARKVLNEFPMIDQLSSLSPIPNFRTWLLERIKQNPGEIFNKEEREAVETILKSTDLFNKLKQTFNNSLWTSDKELSEVLKVPLIRSCARYLYKEKRRNYALNSVANFHLRNGAIMWRINWLADPSPRGAANSCGIMVNYRYYLDETESNSKNYIEKYIIKASSGVLDLAVQAEKVMAK